MNEQKREDGTPAKGLIVPIGVGVLSLAAIIGGVGVFAAAQASGATGSKVVICHHTSAGNNPYVQNEIDTDSIDNPADDPTPSESGSASPSTSVTPSGAPSESASATPSETKSNNGGGNDKQPRAAKNSNYLNGHGDHTGPVYAPDATEWGDIIPPFTSPKGNSFAGYNWTATGQAIYANGCNYATPSESATPTTTASPTVTSTPTSTPTPTPTKSQTQGGGGGGGGATPAPAVSGASVTSTEPTAPGAATVAPGTAPEMPNPVAVAPGAVNIAPGTVTSVPAGNGELVLSLAGMTLIGGGIAGVAGTSVWIADRRRRRTA